MPIFQSTAYAKEHPDLNLEAYRLGEKRLRMLGVEVSKLRAHLRKEALHQANAEAREHGRDVMEVSRLARRAQRGAFRDQVAEKAMLAPDIDERVAVGRRQRSKRRGPVTLNEKIDIVHRVLIGFEKHADVARELRVAPSVVAMVIYKAKQKKEVLRELLNKREEAASRRETIKAFTEGLNARRVVIDNVE